MMWLRDCQHNENASKCDAALYRRTLRNLLPRPTSINNSGPCCLISSSFCSCCISNNFAFSMNHHQISVTDDQSSKDEKHMDHIVSSRWNPTPEQLMALEEMYRRGLRTPSAEEIKIISAKLRQFGKIEGKNVFYWFQNHKARERQKGRRQLDLTSKNFVNDSETLQGNDAGGFSSKDLEDEQKNGFIAMSKEPVSMQISRETEWEAGGRTDLEDRELQLKSQRKIAKGSTSTKVMDLLPCKAPHSDILNTINTQESSEEAQQKMLRALNFSIFSSTSCNEEEEARAHQTLQLFPLTTEGQSTSIGVSKGDVKELMDTMNSKLPPPNQFYEFL